MMSKASMTCLILGSACLIVGILVSADLIDGSRAPILYGALPVGVVLLGFFGISFMLKKEAAAFDKEHANHK